MKTKEGLAGTGSQVSLSLSFLMVFVSLLSQDPVWACGSIDTWISIYERGEKHKALFHLLDCADSYVAPPDDVALLPVIKDALGRDSKVASLAVQVFVNFNHLWGARQLPGYVDVLKAASGINGLESLSNYRDWMVVTTTGGANMREHPSLESRVVTSVKYGMQVKILSRQGDWIKVRPVGPGSVDPRFERQEGYIHESLLAPY